MKTFATSASREQTLIWTSVEHVDTHTRTHAHAHTHTHTYAHTRAHTRTHSSIPQWAESVNGKRASIVVCWWVTSCLQLTVLLPGFHTHTHTHTHTRLLKTSFFINSSSVLDSFRLLSIIIIWNTSALSVLIRHEVASSLLLDTQQLTFYTSCVLL